MNNNESPNFFDRRTISALVIVFVSFMGWQYYMQKKYPQVFLKKTQVEDTKPATTSPNGTAVTPKLEAPNPADSPEAKQASTAETFFDINSGNLHLQISSRGMGLKQAKLLHFTSRGGATEEFYSTQSPYSFETRFSGASQAIDFAVEKISDNTWVGHAKQGALEITKTLTFDFEKYSLDMKIVVQGQDAKFIGLTTVVADQVEPQKPANFFNRSMERQEAFVDTTTSHNNHVYFANEPISQAWTNVHVVALGSQYFTQALVDHSSVIPDAKLHVDLTQHSAIMTIDHSALNKTGNFEVHMTGFVGPKSLALLKSVDEDFVPVVDFGFFSTIARYILAMLKGFYAIIGNWGISIILLTILVRLLVLPFNIMSYKSMKAMQVLQPQMQAVRERYKDDSQRQNQEVMALMREHKVNPMGGCLPLILQFPIFLALYQVLGHSIELYQAPFGLWIHDLSLKDPYYILPVLMGITMFLQQSITPSPSMDPNQQKIMKFVPIIFTFFMITLPSGLTLYIWISSLFAVIQQAYFMKTKPAPVMRAQRIN